LETNKIENMETQELVKVEKKEVAEIVQNPPPQSVFDMKTFEHAQRVAKMLSSSNLIPKEYQGNIQNTMIALEMAHRIGASPLMVMQNLYVVHGKPGWSSTFIIAAINSCRRFSPLRFVMDGTGDDYGCQCWAYDLATNEKLEGPKVTLKMARAEGWVEKTGSKWKTMPELMFRYRAAAFFGRLYAPDILMGMQTMEEIVDVRPGPAVGPDDLIQTTVEDLALQFDMKKGFLTEDERANCERIIANKETASYPKLSKLLQSK
jgi:hypothetical protein